MNDDIIFHYDSLIDEGNDPVLDPPELREYMDRWDGEAFLRLLGICGDERVLEIGCGTGRLAVRVAPLAREFVGVDISPKTVAVAREHLASTNARVICSDFLTWECDGKFDVIYSSLTFMHISDKLGAIRKVASLLSDGGRFVLSVDRNTSEWLEYGSRRVKLYPDDPSEIEKMMKAVGLTVADRAETEFAHIIVAEMDSGS